MKAYMHSVSHAVLFRLPVSWFSKHRPLTFDISRYMKKLRKPSVAAPHAEHSWALFSKMSWPKHIQVPFKLCTGILGDYMDSQRPAAWFPMPSDDVPPGRTFRSIALMNFNAWLTIHPLSLQETEARGLYYFYSTNAQEETLRWGLPKQTNFWWSMNSTVRQILTGWKHTHGGQVIKTMAGPTGQVLVLKVKTWLDNTIDFGIF